MSKKKKEDPEKMMKDLVDKSTIVKSVSEICDLWPESISKAFYLNGNKKQLYFLVDRPKYVRSSTIRSIMVCFKVMEGIPVTLTELTYYHTDEITPIPLSEYKEKVMEIFQALINKTEQTPEDITLIQSYENNLGFRI